ncbi:cysteine--tRNA ligase [Cyanobacterium stanieri LEGE 03274]|uniref:Cysteine--tRNA ligase n=1 Tax=Cyanobacterium stanieri LEGE 03274 TaxID=1828756 RepID=A0ABR9V5B7_9CHRO|nr:cysteine--tRNA ligase [Cyanobacterium stanieri]MBE9223083.1 cysteine--tRNA ligase [Cyanobacterium stanieri LEGE 03274]
MINSKITLYNSLSNREEEFNTVTENEVKMYCCGITVYDYCHLGHARTCIVWDVVRKYLQWRGYKVTYIQNFTDIDDKILNRARQENSSMEEVSERFIKAYFEDMEKLNVTPADAYPRATHALDGIKKLVWELEQKGYAYEKGGDVYYSVNKFSPYGKLSGRKLEDLQAGAGGRVNQSGVEKENSFDFALWKSAKPGEPSFDSPWGKGRPGWHIECSAMVREMLGETIDIHAGGNDLIFPHHENEIAQSEAVTGKSLANYWMHNGMVKVEGEKMSKSLGNFITIRELLEQYEPMAVRLFVLQANYRKPIDFTKDAMESATNGWHTFAEGLQFGLKHGEALNWTPKTQHSIIKSVQERFCQEVDRDFNFAAGIAILFDLAKELRKEANILIHEGKTTISSQELGDKWYTLTSLARVLGLEDNYDESESISNQMSDEEVEALVQERIVARQNKNYAQGDRIRDILKEQGVTLIDSPGGVTKWHR